MQDLSFDPARQQADKLNVQTAAPAALDPAALKDAIAQKVRADSRERGALTLEHEVFALAEDQPPEAINQVLAMMGAEAAYADIKAVVAPSGRMYLFSLAHLMQPDAQRKAQLQESKWAVAERIRSDSSALSLTPADALEPLFPAADPQERAALLAEMEQDERFRDLVKLEGPEGVAYFHSDTYLSGAYARILARAKSSDASRAIAELVRDRSRTIPRPTSVATFRDRAFGIDSARLDEVVQQTLANPEFSDIRKLVHPETGAAYLYSQRWLSEQQAFLMVDWDEVGAVRYP
ncbi:MAG TPA: hypothetical protein VLW85_10485 [Myxococcales bacterium]|nr:hypothetical protein [Myxococcales bacterium]